MHKAASVTYSVYCAWVLFTILGPISYGHGLGDLFYHAAALIAFIVITILFILARKIKSADDVFYIFMFLAIVLTVVCFSLEFTIWRGPEYRWDGNVFS